MEKLKNMVSVEKHDPENMVENMKTENTIQKDVKK